MARLALRSAGDVRGAGMYSALPYAVAQGTVETPYIFVQALFFSVITYFLFHLQVDAGATRCSCRNWGQRGRVRIASVEGWPTGVTKAQPAPFQQKLRQTTFRSKRAGGILAGCPAA